MTIKPTVAFSRTRILSGFDGKTCKIYPNWIQTEHAGFLTYSTLLLTGDDVFLDSGFVKSTDGGQTFSAPQTLPRLETVSGGLRTLFSCATEYYSTYHKTWFVFGHRHSYDSDKHPIRVGNVATGQAEFLLRNCETGQYLGEPAALPFPYPYISATPHAQVIEYENGEFLLSFYFVPQGETKMKSLAVRYRFENNTLSIVAFGTPLSYPAAARGIGEPSIARLGETYYMTLRSDEQGLLAVSTDGLHYSEPTPWKWDDGSTLENYNTMQRWIRHKDALYLAYTRRGANNDHVFRHRAPIFMARFDETRQCLVKDTEVILVPELGARLGNFTVAERSDNTFWLLTAEWMQPLGCEKYGSDNSIWIAKVQIQP